MEPDRHNPQRAATSREAGPERWSVGDLIDFDYYVDEDERLARASVAERNRLIERDRRLYRERIEQAAADSVEHTPRHRSRVLRLWLAARRSAEDPELRPLLPGAAFARGQRLVSIGLGLLGFLIGVGVASALLHYDGTHPVNVSWYVFVLVLVQILLVGVTAVLWLARRTAAMQAAAQDVSLLGHLIKPLFSRAAAWVQRQRLTHVPPDVRARARSRQGLLESHFALYGPAAYLPMLIPAQIFGIGLNIGAIVITVALEWFTDLAFGWGSALDVEPGTIHAIAQAIALPWSWLFGDGVGVPTLEQVAGTRIALKDPLYLLDAEHLRSWRWFLVLAVLTYGLLPRLVLLTLSVIKQRRTLAALPFTHQRTQALYARMITPSLETAGASGSGPAMPIPGPLKPLSAPRAAPGAAAESAPTPAPAPRPMHEPTQGPEPTPAEPPQRGRSGEGAVGLESAEAEARPRRQPRTPPAPRPEPPAARGSGAARVPTQARKAPPPRPDTVQSRAEPAVAAAAKTPAAPAEKPKPKPEPKGPVDAGGARAAEQALPASRLPGSAAEARAEPVHRPEAVTKPEPEPTPGPRRARTSAAAQRAEIVADACVLLIHVDVADVLEETDHGRLQQMLRQQSGWRVAVSATFGGGSAMAEQALGLVEQSRWQAPPARVAVLQDGSQPPITENLRFLRALRAAAGEQAQILLTLVGDPDGDDALSPLAEFDFADWQRKIEQMGDPYLRLDTLAGQVEEGT